MRRLLVVVTTLLTLAVIVPATASATVPDVVSALQHVSSGTYSQADYDVVVGFQNWLAQNGGNNTLGWPASATTSDAAKYTAELAGRSSSGGVYGSNTSVQYTTGNAPATANGGESALTDTAAADVTVATESEAVAASTGLAATDATVAASIGAAGAIPVAGQIGATFLVGYGIGSMIRSWIFPGDSAGQARATNYSYGNPTWAFKTTGGTFVQRAPGTPVNTPSASYPANVFVWSYPQSGGPFNTTIQHDSGCDNPPWLNVPPPPDARTGMTVYHSATFTCGGTNDWEAYTFRPENVPKGPSKFGGTPNITVNPPALPSRTTNITNLYNAMNDPANADLAAWANAQIGSGTTPAVAGPQLVTLPAPTPNELATDYKTDLQNAGFATVTITTVTPTNEDPAFGPNEVISSQPARGTRVKPDSTPVTINANPSDAPTPSGDPNGSPSSGSGGSPLFTPPAIPSLNMDPLKAAGNLCTTFPFGIPCWMARLVGEFVGDPTTPSFTFHFPFGGDGNNTTISLSMFDPYMPAIRTIIGITVIARLMWLFYGLAFGGVAASSKEEDD